MVYRNTVSPRMGVTWLYHHEGVHYLYYLAERQVGGPFAGVEMATSTDGVHYEEIGSIIEKAPDAEWLGTGSVWAVGNKFVMNFSECRDGVQAVFFAESDDLIHWARLGDEYTIHPDPRWYDDTRNGRWDCIWVQPKVDGGGWWGYLTAVPWPIDKHPEGLPYRSIGMVESDDGYHWRAVRPPAIDWGSLPGELNEVGAIEKIGNRYHLMLGGCLQEGDCGSMYSFLGEKPDGPFKADEEAFRLLGQKAHMMTYFARFYPSPDGMLVNHHSITRSDVRYLAPLKRAVVDPGGHLRLGYWEANDSLKGKPVRLELPPEVRQPEAGTVHVIDHTFDLTRGLILEGTITLRPGSDAGGAGLFIEADAKGGTALLPGVDGATRIGPFEHGKGIKPDDVTPVGLETGKPNRFRLLLRHSLCEFYLNDALVQRYSLPETLTGRVGPLCEGGGTEFADVNAWEMDLTGP